MKEHMSIQEARQKSVEHLKEYYEYPYDDPEVLDSLAHKYMDSIEAELEAYQVKPELRIFHWIRHKLGLVE